MTKNLHQSSMRKRKLRKQVKIVLGVAIAIPLLLLGLFVFKNIQATHINNGNMSVEESFRDFMATTTNFNMAEKVNTTEARGNNYINKQKEIISILDNKTYKVNRYTSIDKVPNGIYPFPYFYSTWFMKQLTIDKITDEYIDFDLTVEEIGWQTSASPERGDIVIPDEFLYRTKAEEKHIVNVRLFYRILNGQVVFEIDKNFDTALGQYSATWSHEKVRELELEKYAK